MGEGCPSRKLAVPEGRCTLWEKEIRAVDSWPALAPSPATGCTLSAVLDTAVHGSCPQGPGLASFNSRGGGTGLSVFPEASSLQGGCRPPLSPQRTRAPDRTVLEILQQSTGLEMGRPRVAVHALPGTQA